VPNWLMNRYAHVLNSNCKQVIVNKQPAIVSAGMTAATAVTSSDIPSLLTMLASIPSPRTPFTTIHLTGNRLLKVQQVISSSQDRKTSAARQIDHNHNAKEMTHSSCLDFPITALSLALSSSRPITVEKAQKADIPQHRAAPQPTNATTMSSSADCCTPDEAYLLRYALVGKLCAIRVDICTHHCRHYHRIIGYRSTPFVRSTAGAYEHRRNR
jgi:hypothetical protein